MKFTLKIMIFSLLFSLFCMVSFHFVCQLLTKNIYVCQVGIYEIEENKEIKMTQLKQDGYDTYVYFKNNQYYVLSMISENLSEITLHADNVNGLVKTYQVDNNTTYEELLNQLEEGEISD
ncbi:MAG: hypothetical protein LUG60_14260 [Erysipelotrichaceae bacterium]|nr:hypothetical protein [Erysipelotrichaceae bacterium]